jgi:DNA polymerase I-like protein with 3'-5' exonuclease and polymerase domains
MDDVATFQRWLSQDRKVLAFDIETSGLDWRNDRIRLAQFGDTRTGWVLNYEEWRGVVRDALLNYRGQITGHNIRFDLHFITHDLSVPTSDLPWWRIHDTMNMAHLIDPTRPKGLKPLAARYIDAAAVAGQRQLDDDMRRGKWDWATVPIELESYRFYAGLDTILSAILWEKFHPYVMSRYPQAYELEQIVSHPLFAMERHGMLLDADYTQQAQVDLMERASQIACEVQQTYGLENIGSNPQLRDKLLEQGWVPDIDQLTPAGVRAVDQYIAGADGVVEQAVLTEISRKYPSLRAEVLEELAQGFPLAHDVVQYRLAAKASSTWLQNFLDRQDPETGRVHPSIRQVAARTGRMCLPDTHQLLTATGPKPIDHVEVGDMTLDADGNWVPVQEVFRYQDQPVIQRVSTTHVLESTEEHRWVCTTEKRPDHRLIEPIHGKRRNVRLAPYVPYSFDFTERGWQVSDEQQLHAAIIGLLVSDGRCVMSGKELRCYIYQTERKFYREIMSLLPEDAVMYDRITQSGDLHHEIRLNTRWVRPILEAVGLVPDDGEVLRLHPNLTSWVSTLSHDETDAFLRSVWLADGSTAHPQNKKISCASKPLRDAIKLAAYRLGWVSHTTVDRPGGWSSMPRLGVKMSRPVCSTRSMQTSERRSDVWCVRTETGTFTAWDERGPYLTGNSITDPPLQTLPREADARAKGLPSIRDCFVAPEGHRLISADFSSIEARLFAHFAAEPDMLRTIHEGGDLHALVAAAAYQIPIESVSKWQRQVAKSVNFACAPLDTDVLTVERGWVPIADVQVGETVYGYEDGATRRTKVEATHLYDSAPVIEFGNVHRKFRCTPNHRWLIERWVRTGDGSRRLDGIDTDDLSTLRSEHRILLAAPCDEPDTSGLTPDEAALIAWMVTDGHVRTSSLSGTTSQGADGERQGCSAAIYQKPGGIPYNELRSLLRRLDVDDTPGIYGGTSAHRFKVPTDLARRLIRSYTYDVSRYRSSALSDLVQRFGAEQRRAFIDAFHLAEGWVSGTSVQLSQNVGPTLDAILLALSLEGYYPSVSITPQERVPMASADHATVNIGLPHMTNQRITTTEIGHEPVACLTTGLGTFMARQGDRIFLTGNSLYGAGPAKVAATAGITLEEAQDFFKRRDIAFPGIKLFQRGIQDEAQHQRQHGDRGHVTTHVGSRISILDSEPEYRLTNYLIQGSAAVVLKDRIVSLHNAGLTDIMVLPIHDEVLFEVPEADCEEVTRIIEANMPDRNTFDVPLDIEVSEPALSWGAAK